MPGILIDVTRLLHRFINKRLPTGVDRVSLAYIRHYAPEARAVLRHKGGKFVFRHKESKSLFDWLLSLGTTGSPMQLIYKGLLSGCLSQGVKGRFLFNTGHNGLESDDYVTMLQRQQVKPLFMVHDLIPITHPQFCRDGEHARHLNRMRNAMRVASGIVCNSQATLSALVDLCCKEKWPMPLTTVALLAPELPIAVQASRPVVSPYFVFVSTVEPRKNHLMILRVWQKLAAQMGESAPRLIIIGQRGWDFDEVIDLLAQSDVLKRLVTNISSCSDAEMVNYLQHAQAMVFPSFTEGYGMPVVEALAHGVPVIASNLPVFQEFAGIIPEYLAVSDEARWVEMITDYSDPASQTRRAQMVRMESFVAPTWASHFSHVDALLVELMQREVRRA